MSFRAMRCSALLLGLPAMATLRSTRAAGTGAPDDTSGAQRAFTDSSLTLPNEDRRTDGVTSSLTTIRDLNLRNAAAVRTAESFSTEGITVGGDAIDAAGDSVPSEAVVEGARIATVGDGIDLNEPPRCDVKPSIARVRHTHALGIPVARRCKQRPGPPRPHDAHRVGWQRGQRSSGRTPRSAPTHDASLSDSEIDDTGTTGCWQGQATIARSQATGGTGSRDLHRVLVDGQTAADRQRNHPMAYGIHSDGRGRAVAHPARSLGHTVDAMHVASMACLRIGRADATVQD